MAILLSISKEKFSFGDIDANNIEISANNITSSGSLSASKNIKIDANKMANIWRSEYER